MTDAQWAQLREQIREEVELASMVASIRDADIDSHTDAIMVIIDGVLG